jgi:hypothetical protein
LKNSKKELFRPRYSFLQNINGKNDAKNQYGRKIKNKVKQANSQNLGMTKLASCRLFTTMKTPDCQQPMPKKYILLMPFTSPFIIFSSSS